MVIEIDLQPVVLSGLEAVADVAVDAGARAEALSWSHNTRKAYVSSPRKVPI